MPNKEDLMLHSKTQVYVGDPESGEYLKCALGKTKKGRAYKVQKPSVVTKQTGFQDVLLPQA